MVKHARRAADVAGRPSPGRLAVVMEYVAWGSLSNWVAANREQTDEAAMTHRVEIARGVVSGMIFLHEHG